MSLLLEKIYESFQVSGYFHHKQKEIDIDVPWQKTTQFYSFFSAANFCKYAR